MKLINYKCSKCNSIKEEIYNDTEEVLEFIECLCGEKMAKFNFKNNKQRVFIFDPKK